MKKRNIFSRLILRLSFLFLEMHLYPWNQVKSSLDVNNSSDVTQTIWGRKIICPNNRLRESIRRSDLNRREKWRISFLAGSFIPYLAFLCQYIRQSFEVLVVVLISPIYLGGKRRRLHEDQLTSSVEVLLIRGGKRVNYYVVLEKKVLSVMQEVAFLRNDRGINWFSICWGFLDCRR